MNSRRPSAYLRRYLVSGPTARHGQWLVIPRDTEGDSGCRVPDRPDGVRSAAAGTRVGATDKYDDDDGPCYRTTVKETYSTEKYEEELPLPGI